MGSKGTARFVRVEQMLLGPGDLIRCGGMGSTTRLIVGAYEECDLLFTVAFTRVGARSTAIWDDLGNVRPDAAPTVTVYSTDDENIPRGCCVPLLARGRTADYDEDRWWYPVESQLIEDCRAIEKMMQYVQNNPKMRGLTL